MAPGTILLIVMVAVPVLVLIWFSLLGTTERPTDLSLEHYSRLLDNSLYLDLFLKSLLVATTVGIVTSLLAWPAAWALSRINAARRQVLLSLIIVPYLTSLLLLIYAVFVLLGPGGPVMSVLDAVGVASSDSTVIYSNKATLIMLVYENLPIMIVVLFSASERIDNSLLAAATSLGAGPIQRFLKIVLPMSVPSLVTGFILVFVPVGGAFVEAEILGGPNGQLLGNVIADQLTVTNNPYFGASLSVMLLVGILVVVGLLQLLTTLARSRRGAL
jgi:ABC-type spermidine/putrescine transport system permease subunit I